jgi:hypothetical protein
MIGNRSNAHDLESWDKTTMGKIGCAFICFLDSHVYKLRQKEGGYYETHRTNLKFPTSRTASNYISKLVL